MFDPSLISDNRVEFYEVLDRDNGFYLAVYSFFNKGFADSMGFRILVVGTRMFVSINFVIKVFPVRSIPVKCLFHNMTEMRGWNCQKRGFLA
jgi:hypothetical protein